MAGHNRSDDLFMYIKRSIDGLRHNAIYQIEFEVQIATQIPVGTIGIGGSPGESVFLKAGAASIEPVPIVETGLIQDFYRLNVDKGNQSQSGRNALVLGNIAKESGDLSTMFELKTLSNIQRPLEARTNRNGRMWIFVGTDSGFEGRTQLFYTQVSVKFSLVRH